MHFQGWFPAFGDETGSFDANEIANIQKAKKIDQLRANFFCVNINLNASGGIAQIEKMALAHVTMGGDTAGGAKGFAFFEFLAHFRNGSARLESGAEWLDPFRAQRVEFFAPQRD